MIVELDGERPAALAIPHGVAHGFYFHEPSLHVYAVSAYWDPEDELGCHWADPDLEIPWPAPRPRCRSATTRARPFGRRSTGDSLRNHSEQRAQARYGQQSLARAPRDDDAMAWSSALSSAASACVRSHSPSRHR